MLFNSAEFIFVFLPAALAGFFLLGRRAQPLAIAWLIAASLVFYAWWRPLNVLIIIPSLLVNYALARVMLGMAQESGQTGRRRLLLIAGIAFNLCFLGYFKYINFAVGVVNDLAGTDFLWAQVVLPLGISFITFQKIAFLVDVHGGRIRQFGARDYALFVLFFPQLIAGPIVHYREMMPQFQRATCRPDATDVAVGITLFVLGLFKKVVLADGVAAHVSPVYAAAAAGQEISLLPAWIAAVGFTLQIYFDFSGYSDMALGLARLFGIRLPANFDSPLKATSIIDFWLRWHMTLTRFLTAYLYNPIVLWLTRRRMARGLPPYTGRKFSAGGFLQLLALPTLITMLVSGVWHGAGYTFIAWGLLHGVYLVINHGWRLATRAIADRAASRRVMAPAGWLLTFVAVAVAMVVFRAPDIATAVRLLEAMAGSNGLMLPAALLDRLGAAASLLPGVAAARGGLESGLMPALAWIAALLTIALALPNSLQWVARFEPAVDFRARPWMGHRLSWQPTLAWAGLVSALAGAVALRLGGRSEFLYWQF